MARATQEGPHQDLSTINQRRPPMRTFRLLARILCTGVIACLEARFASACSDSVREPGTYAIVAVDDQGVLPRAELDQFIDTLAQFLLDHGCVRGDQTLIDDPGRAATVFRIQIAWNEDRTSFAISSVAPDPDSGSGCAGDSPGCAAPTPLPYDDWSCDPWFYDDDWCWSADGYGPCYPFFTAYPLIPFYGFCRYGYRPHRDHCPPAGDRPPSHASHRPRDNERESPPHSPGRDRAHSGHDRPGPLRGSTTRTRPAPGADLRPSPGETPPPANPNVRPSPTRVSSRASAPPRHYGSTTAPPAHAPASSPHYSRPPQQSSSPLSPRSHPPSPRQAPAPQRSCSPSSSHSSPPPSSSRSYDSSRSYAQTRQR